jgi:hypothetical protein
LVFLLFISYLKMKCKGWWSPTYFFPLWSVFLVTCLMNIIYLYLFRSIKIYFISVL